MGDINYDSSDNFSSLQKSDREYQNIIASGQSSFIKLIAIFGILNSTVQPAILYISSRTIISMSEIVLNVVIFLIALSYLILLKFRHLLSFTNTYITVMGYLGIFYLIYGSQNSSSEGNIFYITLLPLMGFFFLGKKGGVIYSAIVFLGIAGCSFIPFLPTSKLYSTMQIIQMISVLFAQVFFLYFYQNIVNQTHALIKGQADKLKDANDTNEKTIVILQEQKNQLEQQTQKIQQHEQTLVQQKNTLQELNTVMVDREMRMVELKKQIAELQKQLETK
jgi:hypothetical protein